MLRERFKESLLALTGRGSDSERANWPALLLAVSGGIDSMALAHLVHSVDYPRFAVANVNFSLRGEDSDADQALVEIWCRERGIKFFSSRFDTNKYAEERGISTQMAARDLRLEWFREIAQSEGCSYIVIAHNLNDRAETLILNLLRGTGIKGLSAIRDISSPAGDSAPVIRPLLGFSREEIEEYAKSVNLQYRHDKTNFESHYSRNRVRNDVFPHFREINSHFLKTLERNIELFSETGQIIDERFADIKKRIVKCETEEGIKKVSVDINELKASGHAGYWLFMILEEYGFNASVARDVCESLDSESGKLFESSKYRVLKDRDYLIIMPVKTGSLLESDLSSSVSTSVYELFDGFTPVPSDSIFYLDADKTGYPVSFRRWRSGDRFRPLGMKGFKKVSDYLTDKKRDLFTKEERMVALSESGEIICLLGERVDDRYKITEQTKRVLEIKFRF